MIHAMSDRGWKPRRIAKISRAMVRYRTQQSARDRIEAFVWTIIKSYARSFTSDACASKACWKLNDDSSFNASDIIGHASRERPWGTNSFCWSRSCPIASRLGGSFFLSFRRDHLRYAYDFSLDLNIMLTWFCLLSFFPRDGIALKVLVDGWVGRMMLGKLRADS